MFSELSGVRSLLFPNYCYYDDDDDDDDDDDYYY